jgi:hypothetical protein
MCMCYRVRSSCTLARYKSSLQKEKDLRDEVAEVRGGPRQQSRHSAFVLHNDLVEAKLGEYQSKYYVCTHGWKKRKNKKALGKRKRNVLRSNGCEAFMKVHAFARRGDNDAVICGVEVISAFCKHNHPVSEGAYRLYAENRRITESTVLDLMSKAAKWRASVSDIVADLRMTTGTYSCEVCDRL